MSSFFELYLRRCAEGRVEPFYGFLENALGRVLAADVDFVSDDAWLVACNAMRNATSGDLATVRLCRGKNHGLIHPARSSRRLVPASSQGPPPAWDAKGSSSLRLALGVASLLRLSPSLQVLELANLPLDRNVAKVTQNLAYARALRVLSLQGGGIGDAAFRELATVLRQLPLLSELNVSGCALSDESGACLAQVLSLQQTRAASANKAAGRRLNEYEKHQRVVRGGALVGGLQRLVLRQNYLGDAALKAMCGALGRNEALTALDLSVNGIVDAAPLRDLLRGPARPSSLQSIDLEGNAAAAAIVCDDGDDWLRWGNMPPAFRVVEGARRGSCEIVAVTAEDTAVPTPVVAASGKAGVRQHQQRPKPLAADAVGADDEAELLSPLTPAAVPQLHSRLSPVAAAAAAGCSHHAEPTAVATATVAAVLAAMQQEGALFPRFGASAAQQQQQQQSSAYTRDQTTSPVHGDGADPAPLALGQLEAEAALTAPPAESAVAPPSFVPHDADAAPTDPVDTAAVPPDATAPDATPDAAEGDVEDGEGDAVVGPATEAALTEYVRMAMTSNRLHTESVVARLEAELLSQRKLLEDQRDGQDALLAAAAARDAADAEGGSDDDDDDDGDAAATNTRRAKQSANKTRHVERPAVAVPTPKVVVVHADAANTGPGEATAARLRDAVAAAMERVSGDMRQHLTEHAGAGGPNVMPSKTAAAASVSKRLHNLGW